MLHAIISEKGRKIELNRRSKIKARMLEIEHQLPDHYRQHPEWNVLRQRLTLVERIIRSKSF